MKRFYIIFASLAIITTAAFASLTMIDNKQAPPIALPDAYVIANHTFGSATNQFHCLTAQFIGSYGVPGAWMFSFYNTNGMLKTVVVRPDRSTVVCDGQPGF